MNQFDPSRLFAGIYDCNHQASVTAKGTNTDAVQYFLGRMRLDAILSKKIVLTDGLIYDGAFFLAAANRGRLEQLPLDRIEIRSRAKTLDEAILRVFCDPERSNLREIFLDSIPEKDAKVLQEGLRQFPSARIDNWKKLPGVFVELGLPKDHAEKLESAWAGWIEATSAGRVSFLQWDPFKWAECFERNLDQDKKLVSESLVTDLGRGVFDLVWNARKMRSGVAATLLNARIQSQGFDETVDLATIETWYETAFNRTTAEHQRCGATDLIEAPNARPIRRDQKLFDQFFDELMDGHVELFPSDLIVNIPPSFISSLAILDGNTLVRFIDDNKDALEAWYISGSIGVLKRPIYSLVEMVDRIAPFEDNNPILAKVEPPVRFVVQGGAKAIGAIIGAQAAKAWGPDIGKAVGQMSGEGLDQMTSPLLKPIGKHARVTRCILELASYLRKG